jgi:hypothetical protein
LGGVIPAGWGLGLRVILAPLMAGF